MLENYGSWAKSGPLSTFVNEGFGGHGYTHLLTHACSCFQTTTAESSGCNGDHTIHKA